MPLLLTAAAFIGGAVFLHMQKSLPGWEWALLALPFLPCLFFRRARMAALAFLIFGGGFYYAFWRAELRLAEKIPAELQWRDIVVEGVVRGFPNVDARRTRFDFDIEKAVAPQAALRLRARLYDYHRARAPFAGIKTGARLRLKIRIRPPRANFNPDGFDYVGQLFSFGIRAAGYVRAREKTAVVLREGGGLRDSLRRRAQSMGEGGVVGGVDCRRPFGDFRFAVAGFAAHRHGAFTEYIGNAHYFSGGICRIVGGVFLAAQPKINANYAGAKSGACRDCSGGVGIRFFGGIWRAGAAQCFNVFCRRGGGVGRRNDLGAARTGGGGNCGCRAGPVGGIITRILVVVYAGGGGGVCGG